MIHTMPYTPIAMECECFIRNEYAKYGESRNGSKVEVRKHMGHHKMSFCSVLVVLILHSLLVLCWLVKNFTFNVLTNYALCFFFRLLIAQLKSISLLSNGNKSFHFPVATTTTENVHLSHVIVQFKRNRKGCQKRKPKIISICRECVKEYYITRNMNAIPNKYSYSCVWDFGIEHQLSVISNQ